MRVLTLNCQRGQQEDQLRTYLENLFKEKAYDFILLQEVDAKVVAYLQELYGYLMIRDSAEDCIIYLPHYTLIEQENISFQPYVPHSTRIGACIGTFAKNDERLVVCSAHFPWGRYLRARRKALHHLKTHLVQKQGIKILGGDFNTLFFRENHYTRSVLAPEFMQADYDEHSHDSQYIDNKFPYNIIGAAGKVGLRYRSKIDHIFVSGKPVLGVKVHDVVVSDHRPVEVHL
jgi:endonuclease/exonuclease/phosphatase family metal-dependent hydrolase